LEIEKGSRNGILSKVIETEFRCYEASGLAREKLQSDVDELMRIFHETLDEVYGTSDSA